MLEIEGANPFRIRAYRNAVRTLETQTTPLARWLAEGRDLTALQGIGKEMASHVRELCETGRLGLRDEMAARVPAGLVEVMRLPGVGPKKARKLWQELAVADVDALEEAAEAGRVRGVDGLRRAQRGEDPRRHRRLAPPERPHAPRPGRPPRRTAARRPARRVAKRSGSRSPAPTGGAAKRWGTSTCWPSSASRRRPQRLMARFIAYPQVAEVLMRGDTRGSVRFGSRAAGRPAHRAAGELRRGARLLHRLEGAQRAAAPARRRARAAHLASTASSRPATRTARRPTRRRGRRAHRRRERGGGLRQRRPRLDRARAARGPRRDRRRAAGPARAAASW